MLKRPCWSIRFAPARLAPTLALVLVAGGACNSLLGVTPPGSGGRGGSTSPAAGQDGSSGGGDGSIGDGGFDVADSPSSDGVVPADAAVMDALALGACGALFAPTDQTGNLITNGDFSDGDAGWALTLGGRDTGPYFPSTAVSNGRYCVSLQNSTTASGLTIGWPSDASHAASLAGGTTYRLTYQACATSAPDMFEVKVGQAIAPYIADYDVTTDRPGSSFQPVSHTFTPAANDAQAGVAFNFSAKAPPCCPPRGGRRVPGQRHPRARALSRVAHVRRHVQLRWRLRRCWRFRASSRLRSRPDPPARPRRSGCRRHFRGGLANRPWSRRPNQSVHQWTALWQCCRR